MAKTELTIEIEKAFMNWLAKMGTFLCPEVGISVIRPKEMISRDRFTGEKFPYTYNEKVTEIVDILGWESNINNWRCYEIKVTKQDFNSKCAKTFIGNYNYYIIPIDLLEKVQTNVPDGIGIYTYNPKENYYEKIKCYKKAKHQALKVDESILKYSIIKSLYREIEKYTHETSSLKFKNDSLKKEKANLIQDINADIIKECRGTEILSEFQNGFIQCAQEILNVLENKRTRRDK